VLPGVGIAGGEMMAGLNLRSAAGFVERRREKHYRCLPSVPVQVTDHVTTRHDGPAALLRVEAPAASIDSALNQPLSYCPTAIMFFYLTSRVIR
jgi:hypothetical protein